MAVPPKFSAIDLDTHALLLDVDGTLLDIAPKPDLVVVPDELRLVLARLSERCAGAAALVSGRQISVLDRLFDPLRLSAVGVHGAELRVDGKTIDRGLKPLPLPLRQRLKEGASALGLLTEDKGFSFTLHFREAPEKERETKKLAQSVCAEFGAEDIEIAANKMVIEVLRRGATKGRGIEALMAQAPFTGRVPVFIGDDRTDEDGFVTIARMTGLAFSVGRDFPGLAGQFGSPAEVRAALKTLSRA